MPSAVSRSALVLCATGGLLLACLMPLPAAARALGDPPPGFPAISAQVTGVTANGSLFLSNFALGQGSGVTPYLMILNDDGSPVFYRAMPGQCTDFKAQPDGRLTYYDTSSGKYYALNESYAIVDSFTCGNGYTTDLHDLRLLPNGHALLLSYDPEPVDMSLVVPGGRADAVVTGCVIQELDEQKHVVFQWRSWDHFAITDAMPDIDLTAATIDYVHANAIELDTDGNLLLSSRHMDEITKIDHATGDVLWRWGGKHNQFTFLDDSLGFSHQHAIRRLADGRVSLFDNGNLHPTPFSRGVEYELDEVAHTARLVWQYRNVPDIYSFAMGYVERLPNGSTLISWGTGKPDVIEVGYDGQPALTLSLPAGQSSYRALRAVWPPSAVSVTPRPAPIPGVALSAPLPNPSRGAAAVFLTIGAATTASLTVYDLQGRQVSQPLPSARYGAGLYRVELGLEGRPAGVYFAKLETPGRTETRRVVRIN